MNENGVQTILLKNACICVSGSREELLILRKIINKAVSSPRSGQWHDKTNNLEISVKMTENEEVKNEF